MLNPTSLISTIFHKFTSIIIVMSPTKCVALGLARGSAGRLTTCTREPTANYSDNLYSHIHAFECKMSMIIRIICQVNITAKSPRM